MTTPIARLHNPSPAQLDACIAAHRPAIITGLLDGQPASRWDLGSLKAKLGPHTVQVVKQDKPLVYWDPNAGLPIFRMSFDDFVAESFGNQRSGYAYLQDDVNCLPGIIRDYDLPPMLAEKNLWRAKFWLSGTGLVTPLHYDPVETFHWVIQGSKRFLCYRPGVRNYYPYPADSTAPFISRVDPDHVDLDEFPRFRNANAVEFELNAGELLYLPAFWWHQVYSLAAVNISLNFVWTANWRRSLRHLPQMARARRHVALQRARVKAAALAAQRANRLGA